MASDFQVFYLLCFHLLFYYYYFFFFFFAQPIIPNGSTQPINTADQHKPINTQSTQMDQHNRSKTQQIHAPRQTHNPQQPPTTHGKPSHNHGNPKTPPTTTVNPQKLQTQNNQKIKRETKSDQRDHEPNVTTTKPSSSCWPPRARSDATITSQIWSTRSPPNATPAKSTSSHWPLRAKGDVTTVSPCLRSARERKIGEKRKEEEREFVLKWEKKRNKVLLLYWTMHPENKID